MISKDCTIYMHDRKEPLVFPLVRQAAKLNLLDKAAPVVSTDTKATRAMLAYAEQLRLG